MTFRRELSTIIRCPVTKFYIEIQDIILDYSLGLQKCLVYYGSANLTPIDLRRSFKI